MTKYRAPKANDAVAEAMPRSAGEMDQFSSFNDGDFHDFFEIPTDQNLYALLTHAYEGYYKALFRVVQTSPKLLARFFAVADRFGSRDPDDVDEDGWFCGELKKMYRKKTRAYMEAVRETKSEELREFALYCRNTVVP